MTYLSVSIISPVSAVSAGQPSSNTSQANSPSRFPGNSHLSSSVPHATAVITSDTIEIQQRQLVPVEVYVHAPESAPSRDSSTCFKLPQDGLSWYRVGQENQPDFRLLFALSHIVAAGGALACAVSTTKCTLPLHAVYIVGGSSVGGCIANSVENNGQDPNTPFQNLARCGLNRGITSGVITGAAVGISLALGDPISSGLNLGLTSSISEGFNGAFCYFRSLGVVPGPAGPVI